MLNYLYNLKLKQKALLIGFIFTVFSLSSIGYFGLTKANELNHKLVLSQNKNIVTNITNHINLFLTSIPKDLGYLAENYSLKAYLKWNNIGEKQVSNENRNTTNNTYLSFMNSKDYINQIRFINKDGFETIKVTRNSVDKLHNEKVYQNKVNSDYFKKTMPLTKYEIYVSSINLNKEYNKILEPHLPVIQFAKVIVNDDGVSHGIVVMNIYASKLLSLIQTYENEIKKDKGEVFLINKDGYYLYSNDKNKLWGQDLKNNNSLKYDNELLFNAVEKANEGSIIIDNGIYSYKRIYYSPSNLSTYWILITKADKNTALQESYELENIFIVFILTMILFTIFVTNRFISKLINPLLEVSNTLKQLSRGVIPKKYINYSYNDELGDMVSSLGVLVKGHGNTTNLVTKIAQGDYSNEMELLSSEDELAISINHMTNELKRNNQSFKTSSWMTDAYTGLSSLISAEMELNNLANTSLSFICRYLNVNEASFYCINNKNDKLKLIGSFVGSNDIKINDYYNLDDGIIAQVARDKTAIYSDNLKYTSKTSLASHELQYSYIFPLVFDEDTEGVIEIVSNNEINEDAKELLSKLEELLASTLHSVNQRFIIKDLLEESNLVQISLEKQSKELQDTNEQMQEQQQQLEEANSYMEEQQQQLQINSKILKEKNQILIDSQQELNNRANDLEKSNKYKGEFLANMSHELRTPLNSIILLSDMLGENKKKTLDEKDVKKANVIHGSGNELLRLINDILDLSKVEAGKMDLIVDEFESSTFADDIKSQFEFNVEDKNLEFIVMDNYKKVISNDKNRLGQVIRNLLSNSLKFTKNGSITFQIDKEEDNVKLSVIDTGIGIDSAKLDLIFGAFQQADGGTSREYGGTGLGLSISKELSILMKGNLSVESRKNSGSVFSISIPNLKVNENKSSNQSKPVDSYDIITASDDRTKLEVNDKAYLIIEDDEVFAQTLRENINQNEEFALIALTGKEGIHLAKTYNIKGIILDLGLPDIDGIDLLREFKMDKELNKIPIHIVSGEDKNKISEHIGSLNFSQKPVSNKKIESILNEFPKFDNRFHKKILIVEDNKIQRDAIIEFIGDDEISTIGANSVESTIEKLNNLNFDCIVLDLKLENGSGYDICDYIKNNNINTPIIIYTGKDLSVKEINKLNEYTESIIIKTVSSEKRLKAQIHSFMNKKPIEKIEAKVEVSETIDINLTNKKVLVVDDDIRNIYVLSELLDAHGAEVITANDGKESLEVLDETLDIDIILMDIMMPIMDGYEATKAIKSNSKTSHIPVIAITAKTMDEDRRKALEVGCSEYITKPINTKELLAVINKIITS